MKDIILGLLFILAGTAVTAEAFFYASVHQDSLSGWHSSHSLVGSLRDLRFRSFRRSGRANALITTSVDRTTTWPGSNSSSTYGDTRVNVQIDRRFVGTYMQL
jgi:hypothetical protein